MLTLGIETSCDETSCAVLEGLDKIKSNIISSSLFRHKPFGGVVPEIASRHCLEQIDVVFNEALSEARIKPRNLNLIAVTEGPGLIGSLLVGVSFAKSLAYSLRLPIVGVNHLEAHLSANFIGNKEPARYVGLLVSGGHTILSYHQKGRMKILGETVDDAVGEAYDKTAKILGLGYPGGPVIDKLAQQGNPSAFKFTKPKQDNPLDFSFSGIKTAVLHYVAAHPYPPPQRGRGEIFDSHQRRRGEIFDSPSLRLRGEGRGEGKSFIRDMASSFQEAVVSWIVEKTLKAAEIKKVSDVAVGGGVSANLHLRKMLSREGESRGIKIWFPAFTLTLDNAAMIARRGAELYRVGKKDSLKLAGNANLKMGK